MKGGLLLGYARVSKADDQDNSAQVKALRLRCGCKRVFEEKASGGRCDRPQLHTVFWATSRKGMCWSCEARPPSRSLKDILHIMEQISDAGAGFRSSIER